MDELVDVARGLYVILRDVYLIVRIAAALKALVSKIRKPRRRK